MSTTKLLGLATDSRQAPYEERNQSPKSRRRIKKLAQQSGLILPLVHALESRCWNWDDEIFCWVPVGQQNEIPASAVTLLEEGLGWPRDRVIGRDQIIQLAMDFVASGLEPHVPAFLAAVPAQSSWAMSPLMTVAALRGLTSARVSECDVPETLDFDTVCSNATAKLGSFVQKRDDLGYAVVDSLTLHLGAPLPNCDGSWLTEICDAIAELPPGVKLTDLVRAAAPVLKGNKGSRQRILEALGIIGVLRTGEFEPGKDFWPEKVRLSSHFYSNEWTFPMNFWSDSGRVVGPQVLLAARDSCESGLG